MDGSALWVADVAADGSLSAARNVAPSGVADRRPGVAFAPELGATGVCYATGTGPGGGGGADHHDGVSFVLVDGNGAPAGVPLVIADGLENIGGCDTAWSGDSFLVIWWDIELNLNAGSDPKAGSWIFARVLKPS
jgi:hypothetical protein